MVELSLLEQVLRLPAQDRIDLLDEISDSLEAESDLLTPELVALADSRLADLKTNPADWRAWDEVVSELRDRHR